MLRIASLIFALLVSWSACAQVPLTGAGKGAPGGATYQGPGDVVSGATGAWSPARAYNAAYANGTNSLCDLKDKTTGTVAICTLRVLTTGFVDLAGSYCVGSTTPAAACAAAAGGSCVASKVYNQVSPGTADMVQATLAAMPSITFNAINGLPALQFNGSSQFLATSSTITQSAPYGLSSVFKRTSVTAGGYLSADNVVVELRGAGSANNMGFACGTTVAITANPDNAFHAANATCSNVAASDAINVDGTDTTGQTAGTTGLSGTTLWIGKANGGINFLNGLSPEAIMYPFGLSSGQRASLNANQHSATNGYNF